MNSSLFFAWLSRFDAYIERNTGRNVLLLLEIFSGHGKKDHLPELQNTNNSFLPPNTTSVLPPMDAGIIATLKTRYWKLPYERALDLLEESNYQIYKIDQLLAMKYITGVWEDMDEKIINNCWFKTGLLARETSRICDNEDDLPVRETNELLEVIQQLAVPNARMSIRALLNDEDSECHDEPDICSMASSVLHELEGGDSYSEAGNETDEDSTSPSLALSRDGQLAALKTTPEIVDAQLAPNLAVLRYLRRIKRGLATAKVQTQTQKRIDSFF